jgi:hypothetical protein
MNAASTLMRTRSSPSMGRAVWSLQTAETEGTERRSKWRRSGVRRVGRFILLIGPEKRDRGIQGFGGGMSAKDDVRGPRRKVGVCGESRLKKAETCKIEVNSVPLYIRGPGRPYRKWIHTGILWYWGVYAASAAYHH